MEPDRLSCNDFSMSPNDKTKIRLTLSYINLDMRHNQSYICFIDAHVNGLVEVLMVHVIGLVQR